MTFFQIDILFDDSPDHGLVLTVLCHLLRVCKHIDTHRGGNSVCPDNDDDDDDDDENGDTDTDDHDHVKDYIGRAVIWANWATTVTARVLFHLECVMMMMMITSMIMIIMMIRMMMVQVMMMCLYEDEPMEITHVTDGQTDRGIV